MNNSRHLEVLRILTNSIPSSIEWVLTGSTAFAIQGLPINPNDIDIQSNAKGVYEIEQHLSQYSTKPVEFSQVDWIKSHFGELEINNIKVELMGDIQKRLPDCSWEQPVNLSPLIRKYTYNDLVIPILPLSVEYKAYKILGRDSTAKILKDHMEYKQ